MVLSLDGVIIQILIGWELKFAPYILHNYRNIVFYANHFKILLDELYQGYTKFTFDS